MKKNTKRKGMDPKMKLLQNFSKENDQDISYSFGLITSFISSTAFKKHRQMSSPQMTRRIPTNILKYFHLEHLTFCVRGKKIPTNKHFINIFNCVFYSPQEGAHLSSQQLNLKVKEMYWNLEIRLSLQCFFYLFPGRVVMM